MCRNPTHTAHPLSPTSTPPPESRHSPQQVTAPRSQDTVRDKSQHRAAQHSQILAVAPPDVPGLVLHEDVAVVIAHALHVRQIRRRVVSNRSGCCLNREGLSSCLQTLSARRPPLERWLGHRNLLQPYSPQLVHGTSEPDPEVERVSRVVPASARGRSRTSCSVMVQSRARWPIWPHLQHLRLAPLAFSSSLAPLLPLAVTSPGCALRLPNVSSPVGVELS